MDVIKMTTNEYNTTISENDLTTSDYETTTSDYNITNDIEFFMNAACEDLYSKSFCFLARLQRHTFNAAGVACILTLLIAALAWLLIPKWRNYKNYIFANLIIALLGTIATIFIIREVDNANVILQDLLVDIRYGFLYAVNCWMLVLCTAVYGDLVVVFRSTVTRQKLKSALIGWGVPALYTCIKITVRVVIYNYYFTEDYMNVQSANREFLINDIFLCLVLLVNFILFLRVMYSLTRGRRVPGSRRKMSQNVQAAILTFVASGTLMLIFNVIHIVMDFLSQYSFIDGSSFVLALMIAQVIESIQTIVINIFFLLLRSNRTMLLQFMKKKLAKSAVVNKLEPNLAMMNEMR